MQHDLLDPGEPIGAADATEVDGEDIEDDNQGDPEDQDGRIGKLGDLVGNEFGEKPGTQKQTADQLQGGYDIEQQLVIPAEHVGELAGYLASQPASRSESDDAHRHKKQGDENLHYVLRRNNL